MIGILRQMPELPGDISGNGIQPTDEEVEGKANQLVIGKIASLNLRGNAIAQQVFAWCRLTVSDFAPEVVDHLARGLRDDAQIIGVKESHLPFQKSGRERDRETHQFKEDLDRKFEGEIAQIGRESCRERVCKYV